MLALRSEPKTLNPVTNADAASRDVIGRTTACLVCIDRETQRTTPGLAKSWTVSADGRRITLQLRRGLRFSDGHPFDADDVVFSFAGLPGRTRTTRRSAICCSSAASPSRSASVDAYTVAFDMAEPYAVGERLFDGIAMLPRHLLQAAQRKAGWPRPGGSGRRPPRSRASGRFG